MRRHQTSNHPPAKIPNAVDHAVDSDSALMNSCPRAAMAVVEQRQRSARGVVLADHVMAERERLARHVVDVLLQHLGVARVVADVEQVLLRLSPRRLADP